MCGWENNMGGGGSHVLLVPLGGARLSGKMEVCGSCMKEHVLLRCFWKSSAVGGKSEPLFLFM